MKESEEIELGQLNRVKSLRQKRWGFWLDRQCELVTPEKLRVIVTLQTCSLAFRVLLSAFLNHSFVCHFIRVILPTWETAFNDLGAVVLSRVILAVENGIEV